MKFRDTECEAEADDYRGGFIMPLIRNDCAERLAKQRTEQPKSRLDDLEHR